ncbi:carboxymuconolactone decarboxylase family protein [Zhihengliuella salsuginis]|uniref:Alkyl hydroperoxide reductase AhpD n=1 Tax=Zhihengliuella salsuginis TaxID=578222 RepID=A0ABQ3GEV1_9MICC|nr:carboxymuconolactone decarboxylase family protein [Zhihengliuella salsuginis]GHD02365.1 alkyl hydroperoxide reductase AhpD [Zhihengliuella salsuginis]
MSRHLFLDKADPASWKAISALGEEVARTVAAAGISKRCMELVNLRVSQINGCAYCLDLHTKRALKAGETSRRLGVLAAWRETDPGDGLFDATEHAALAVAEAATRLPLSEESHADLAAARGVLGDQAFAAVEWLALAMNAFNRISILSGHPVRPE